jgi:hydroxymethylbilane synthase
MLPSPAQGAIVIVCRKEDADILEACSAMNDEDTATCTMIERNFMRLMMGGCSTPISAYVTISEGKINFQGNITAVDGRDTVDVRVKAPVSEASQIAKRAVDEMAGKRS